MMTMPMSFILAQISAGASEPVERGVPRLPTPAPAVYYTLENPWPLGIALILASVLAYALLNARSRFKMAKVVAALLLLCGIGVIIAGSIITTEREVLREQTRALVDLTAKADTTQLRDMLQETASVLAFGVVPGPRGRDAILDAVRVNLGERYPIGEHSVGSVQACLDGKNVARTQVRVWVKPTEDQKLYDVSTGAWFRLDWQRDPLAERGQFGPWRVSRITVMQIDGLGTREGME